MAVANIKTIDFSSVKQDYSQIPELLNYKTRNNDQLEYRYYHSNSKTVLILIHGSAWHSRYLFPLASKIAKQGIAKVYTPNLRGHGLSPKKRGDVDYIGQLEDDLSDFINFIRNQHKNIPKLILGGHSSGGGFCIKYGGRSHLQHIHSFFLLAPYMRYNAPSTRQDNNWAKASLFKVIILTLLNKMGINWLDHHKTLHFNLLKEYRDGTETLDYSYSLTRSFTAESYEKDIKKIKQPIFMAVGEDDEVMIPDKYKEVFSEHNKSKIMILPSINHMDLVMNPKIIELFKKEFP